MGEWVLPPAAGAKFEEFIHEFKSRADWEELRPFLKGGFWRGFLAKYPEVNYLHKKMLRTSRKYWSLSNRKRDDEFHTPLLRGQCNCPYWHGVFGGLYLPHLRHAAWKQLLNAEYTLDNSLHRGRKWVDIEKVDHDADGSDEILIENAYMNAYVSPRLGGSIFEWDYKPRGYNVLNTLTRRSETYHGKLVLAEEALEAGAESVSIHDLVQSKEENLDKLLRLDSWPRTALMDHFPGWNSTFNEFKEGTLANYGNFRAQPYAIDELFTDAVRLTRVGRIGETPVQMWKTIKTIAGKPLLNIHYRLKNLAAHELHSPFGVEWNLALQAPRSHTHTLSIPDTNVQHRQLEESGETPGVREVRLVDGHERVSAHFRFGNAIKLWRVPIESVSLSEGGFERIFQSVALLFLWELHLAAGAEFEAEFTAILGDA
jgi:alpha-amylase